MISSILESNLCVPQWRQFLCGFCLLISCCYCMAIVNYTRDDSDVILSTIVTASATFEVYAYYVAVD